jgi:prepilin peptidase CpaA
MPFIPAIPMLVAAAVAATAALTDVRTRRIPNWLTGGGLLFGLLLNLLLGSLIDGASGSLSALVSCAAGAALGFALLFPLYVIHVSGVGRAVGAGDVKLMTALGAIAGPQAIVSIAIYGAIAGGAQSLFVLASSGWLWRMVHHALVLQTAPQLSGRKAPYAVAIAAGVCLTLMLPPLMRFS